MKVLITGGSGYIGSHTIVEILDHKDWHVITADNYINSSKSTYDRIKSICKRPFDIVDVDLSKKDALRQLFLDSGPIDGIIHFAALKAVGESVEEPLRYYDNNLSGLINILECCQEFKVKNFIFSSSCSIYGNAEQVPVNEETPLAESESAYASTKAMGEEIIRHFSKISKTKSINLRYFNPVGAHKSGKIGENPINKPNNLVPVITQFASGLIPEMYVYGTDYDTRDGSCIRDYIHVTDIAQAHIKALEFAQKQMSSNLDFFNLGTGNGVSVLEAIRAFEKAANMKLNYKIGPRREGDVVEIFSDSQKAKQNLKWEANIGIEEMMASAWKWQQNINSESK